MSVAKITAILSSFSLVAIIFCQDRKELLIVIFVNHHTKETLKNFVENNNFLIEKIYAPLPINTPVWAKYLGYYYQYPSPWLLDWKKILFRKIFHLIGKFL